MESESQQTPEENFKLYKYEYISSTDSDIYSEWVWVSEDEEKDLNYFEDLNDVKILAYREATDGELEAFNYAFEEGLMLGKVDAKSKLNNGVMHQVVSWGQTNEDGIKEDFQTLKIFYCGRCNERRVFENDVMKAGDEVYLGIYKDGVIWHLCWQCFSGEEKDES